MMDDELEEAGEAETIIDEVEDTDDGGAIVKMSEDAPEGDNEFYANLVEDLSASERGQLALTLLEMIERDAEARKGRDEQQEEGIKRTGLGKEAPGGASFNGASKVVHPMLTEACVDFAARVIKEIFPAGGPVKDRIDGKIDAKKLAKAKRKTALMNWQLTVQVPSFRSELEQLFTQVPLGGGQYLKLRWDKRRNRPDPCFVAIDDMLLPFAATSFYSAQRKTHVQRITKLEYYQRVRDGMYIDADLIAPSSEPDETGSERATNKIEGREATGFNEDGLRKVYECFTTIDLDFDDKADGPAPYIITIDDTTHQILSIYRNWDMDDEAQEELDWFVEYPFIPWRGAYPIGISHMIAGLSSAATGALRALLDSAHIQNSATTLRLKGGLNGQSVTVQPTETVELEGGINADDIRKLAMPMPFNPPSAVLFQLLGFVVDAAKGVVRTSLDTMPEMSPNAPVGTTMAHIEQGLVVYSSIFGRMHHSTARMLKILNRLNAHNLDEERLEREAGELLATREDFDGPLDVVPVSDPNIFSEAQRIAQAQTVAQRAAAMPQLYNQRKVEERILATLKIPNPDDLLNPPLEPKHQNAINENVAASLGRPVTAFPAQDHLSHLKAHVAYMVNPVFGSNPSIAPAFLPVMLGHIREHVAMWYAYAVFEKVSEVLGRDLGDFMREIAEDDDEEDFEDEGRMLDKLLAIAGDEALAEGQQLFMASKLPEIVMQAQQILQQYQPQPMQDPRLAVQAQDLQRKQAKDQQDAALEQGKLSLAAQEQQAQQAKDQQDAAIRQGEQAIERERIAQQAADAAAEREVKRINNTEDNQTALTIAAAEIQSGENVALSTGTGINP